MNSSLKLFSVRGIDIRIHFTFPLILLWAAIQFGLIGGAGLSGALFGIIAVTLLFGLVTLHELGHSFAAQYYGIPVERITLLPIGGVAQLREMPDRPVQELVVALAGPAVNVILAVAMGLLALGTAIDIQNPILIPGGAATLSFQAIFSYLFVYNVFLAIFNLLPAFPMDGGRVLRALLALRLDYVRATSIAVNIGRGLAVLMGLYGFATGQFFLMLIAFFIYSGATQEGWLVRLRGQLRGRTVRQAYTSFVNSVSPYDNLRHVAAVRMRRRQGDFPVVYNGRLVGFLTEARLMESLRRQGPDTLVGEVMARDVEPVTLASDLYDVQQRLGREGVNALPVVENNFLVGLISGRQIQRFLRLLAVRPDLAGGYDAV